jgi:hypothetical protein
LQGACCVDGDVEPLSLEETKTLEEIYPKVKPLRKQGIAAIEAQGTWTTDRW